jgi:septum formation protein
LRLLGLDFEVFPPSLEEGRPEGRPEEAARRLALEKAREVAARTGAARPGSGILVIGADTVVALGKEILGKPAGPEEAVDMLLRLRGRAHQVITGVALVSEGKETVFSERTDVYLRWLERKEAEEYVATGEPLDKAGAYAAQGLGARFVLRVEGCFFNVVGLPLARLYTTLRREGYLL